MPYPPPMEGAQNAPDAGAHRPYDIVLLGATGFTGGLAAEYLSAHLPENARWAIAGRSLTKLKALQERLLDTGSPKSVVEILQADAMDPDSLRGIAESARVVATTVGPYLEHGAALVAACAAAGTDYVDLTGEPEFMDRMYLDHHDTARETGARLVHACGFDSIPHDLGALFTVEQLRAKGPVSIRGIVRSNAMISGGTLHSALGQMSRARQMRQAARQRNRAEPQQERRVRARRGFPHRDDHTGLWLLPLPTCDPVIVTRSAAASEAYGADFTYAHYVGMKRLRSLVKTTAAGAGLMTAAHVGPLRRVIGRKIPQGEGPSPERRERSWFTVDFIGEAGGTTVRTRVSGGDPGYGETAKMLSEAAMCLAFDENPETSGQVTTATAMGQNLMQRLIAAGMEFTVVEARTAAE